MNWKIDPQLYKKAYSIGDKNTGNQEKKKRLENLPPDASVNFKGLAGDTLPEPVPFYIATPCEKVLNGSNNTWLVFGRDRLSSRLTGYGGRGDTQEGSIDLVTG